MSFLLRSPIEFRDRALMIANSRLSVLFPRRPTYEISDWRSAVDRMADALGRELYSVLSEPELVDIISGLRRRMVSLPSWAPLGTFHNADLAPGKLCYAVVRALAPDCVVETGVCYGVTSTFLLAALNRNGKGTLHSIDLPPLRRDGEIFVGWAIPEESLKARWRLRRVVSKKILPALLPQLGPVGLFVHGSLHTYRNMLMEFDLVWPHIPPAGY